MEETTAMLETHAATFTQATAKLERRNEKTDSTLETMVAGLIDTGKKQNELTLSLVREIGWCSAAPAWPALDAMSACLMCVARDLQRA